MAPIRDLYDIRDAIPEDDNFVLASFLRGVYYGNEFYSMIPKAIFMEKYKVVAETLLRDLTKTVVKVASLKDDPSTIIGYSILSSDYQTIHFVYVKKDFRKMGVGRSLVPRHPVAYSHFTTLGKELAKKFNNVIFNPFL